MLPKCRSCTFSYEMYFHNDGPRIAEQLQSEWSCGDMTLVIVHKQWTTWKHRAMQHRRGVVSSDSQTDGLLKTSTTHNAHTMTCRNCTWATLQWPTCKAGHGCFVSSEKDASRMFIDMAQNSSSVPRVGQTLSGFPVKEGSVSGH